MVAKSKVIESN